MLDNHTLRALHAQFPPGHIIDLFNSQRREQQIATFMTVFHKEDKTDYETFFKNLATNLVHPLLLPTLISGAILGVEEYEQYLNNFLAGKSDVNFHQKLFIIENYIKDTELLAEFIKLHEVYLEGLYCYILDTYRPEGKNRFSHQYHMPLVKKLVFDGQSKEGIRKIKKDFGLSAHDVRMRLWIDVNITIHNLGQPKYLEGMKFSFGFKHNSLWHNIQINMKHALEEAKKQFNEQVKTNNTALLLEASKQVKIYQYLNRISQMLYWWNPTEIDAYQVEDEVMESLEKESKKQEKED
jgi:hypothetical protein